MSEIQRQLALVRLQCRQPLVIMEAEGEVLRAFKREIMERRSIIIKALLDVSAFGPLDSQTLESIADAIPQRDIAAGEIVAAQNGIATEFYIIVSGTIRVTRKAVPAATFSKEDQEINRLHPGSNFGAGALLTGEQYTATYQAVGAVTLAVMSADDFHAYADRGIANKSMIGGSEAYPGGARNSEEAGGGGTQSYPRGAGVTNEQLERVTNALNRVPLFAPLSLEQKRLVSNALLEVHFRPGLCICEEGKPGNSFHIITAGRCRVTIHDPNAPEGQREVTKLHQDDFFGEVALMESGLRTATVVAETDVTCLSLARRHFDLYLKPIKAAILENAVTKGVLDIGRDDKSSDENEISSTAKGVRPEMLRQTSKGGEDKADQGKLRGRTVAGSGGEPAGNVCENVKSGEQGRRLHSIRRVATRALQVERRKLINFGEMSTKTSAMSSASQTQSISARQLSGATDYSRKKNDEAGSAASGNDLREDTTLIQNVRSLARSMVLSLGNDLYAMLLDEMLERPKTFPEFSNIVNEVLYENVRQWSDAYRLIRTTIRKVLGKGMKRRRDGELAVVAAIIHLTVLRQRHCSDWPGYQMVELCKRMRFEEVRSFDKVFVYGTHGRKCYVILRGLVRVLCPAEDEQGGFHFRPHGDLGPGDLVGGSVLEGVTHRSSTVVAVTDCEFAVLDESGFSEVNDRRHSQMSMDDKFQFLRSVDMMRSSSTYHLHKIALLLRTVDVAKDNVILKAGRPSKALYFIVEGTVEVIKLNKRRVGKMNTLAGIEPALGGGDVRGGGMCSGHSTAGDWDSPHDSEEDGEGGDEGGVVVFKTARRVLAVLESGEYFGESGVLAFFKEGNKAKEQFCVVAGTNVEMLVLQRKHFHIIDMQILDILKANYNARLIWRARRKREEHRGRAVLRAAQKALDQAALVAEDFEDRPFCARARPPLPKRYLAPSQQSSFNGSDPGSLPGPQPYTRQNALTLRQWGRAPAHGGVVEQGVRAGAATKSLWEASLRREEVNIGDDSEPESGTADSVSLAGLTLASEDSMQYSFGSGWLPILGRGGMLSDGEISGGENMRLIAKVKKSTVEERRDRFNRDHNIIACVQPSHVLGGDESSLGTTHASGSVSLPSLISLVGAPRWDEVDHDNRRGWFERSGVCVREAGQAGRKEWGRSGDNCRGGGLAYAGHKQPGLHGSKSFGAFWEGRKAVAHHNVVHAAPTLLASGRNRSHNADELKRYGTCQNNTAEFVEGRTGPMQHRSCDILEGLEQNTGQCHGQMGLTVSKKWRGKGTALIPIQGISRAAANAF